MNPNLKESFTVTDAYGIDPLLDPRNSWLRSIDRFSSIILEQKYENRPDLLALDYYSDNNLWWVPLMYNGLSFHELKQGISIKMPDINGFHLIARTKGQTKTTTVRV